MATNENGNLVDDKGNVVVEFVWGNFPMQPNDEREENGGGLLDPDLDNHSIAYEGWNGYPLYTPNTAGAEGAGYIVVPSVLGQTTANARDILEDAGLVVTAAAATTNAVSTVTALSRTLKVVTLTSSGAGAKYPTGTSITVTGLSGDAVPLNGTYTVTGTATNSVTYSTTTSGAVSLTGLTAEVLTGTAGTIKTQSLAAGANEVEVGDAITVTPWAAAS
jgi:hypothetical protein